MMLKRDALAEKAAREPLADERRPEASIAVNNVKEAHKLENPWNPNVKEEHFLLETEYIKIRMTRE